MRVVRNVIAHISVLAAAGIAIGALASVGACNGRTASSGSGCATIIDAVIAYEKKCASNALYSVDERDRNVQQCERNDSLPGVATNTDELLRACAGQIQQATAQCNPSANSSQICRAPGTLESGAPCAFDFQCNSLFCQYPTTKTDAGTALTDTHCGICAPTVGVGQPCTQVPDNCAPDSYCSPSHGDGGGITTYTCVSTTGTVDVGGACSSTIRCKDGLHCKYPTMTCSGPEASGDTCAFNEDCAYPLGCVSGKCATALDVGQPCTNGSGCMRDLVCDRASNTCLAPTRVAPGQACDDEVTFCAKGICNLDYTKDVPTGTCPTILADGAACVDVDPAAQCEGPAECINGTCQIFDPSTCK